MKARPGFTLIELLLVIGIIAILACIVIVALNPTQQIGKAHDAQRQLDLTDLADALDRYRIDNKGNLPAGITPVAKPICQQGVPAETCTTKIGGVSLQMLVGDYIEKIPSDPLIPQSGTGTSYMIKKAAGNTFTITAPLVERIEVITVTK
jgi:prepilin-type N-terminal cleavage/methylation domain-containing protein